MNYKYLILGIISFVFGTIYLMNLKKRLNQEYVDKMNLFDFSMKFKGLAGGLGLVITGVILVYQELVKIF